jgi:tetratricopeptide (TPR) repeat protein
MRKLALFGWLLLPVLAGAYHYGPGQDHLRFDDAARTLAVADEYARRGNWSSAISTYDQALTMLPAGQVAEARRIRVERAKAMMLDKQLPEATAELKALVEELQSDKQADAKVLADARASLASAQYYMTWLMKLEGLSAEEWVPEIESSRQLYKLLAEQADDSSDARAREEDVESAIRLALMDPAELQGKAIPKQCQNCKSGQCKKPGKKPGRSEAKEKKDARGASSGPPPDGAGS